MYEYAVNPVVEITKKNALSSNWFVYDISMIPPFKTNLAHLRTFGQELF
jgi:hypothetical protein